MIKMKDKIAYYVSVTTLILAITMLLYFAYLMFYPIKINYNFPDNYSTLKSQYRQGEVFTYRIHYIKYVSYPATAIRSFVDGIAFTLPTIQTNHPMGEQNFIANNVTIPNCLPPGKYTFHATVIFKINAFRDIVIYMKSNEFTVIEDDTKKNVR
jgi:hypothetical protein